MLEGIVIKKVTAGMNFERRGGVNEAPPPEGEALKRFRSKRTFQDTR